MADIRNDGQSRVDIEHAELLGGDINLQIHSNLYWKSGPSMHEGAAFDNSAGIGVASRKSFVPSVGQGEEVAGLYVFTVSTPFSIEGRTNYLLPMFRPRVTIERFALISKYFSTAGASNGKAQRSYRLLSDRFLSKGNCVIREYDRLVGETSLPNLAAKNSYDFSIGEDADVVYKENVTLISSQALSSVSSSYHGTQGQIKTTYNVNLYIKSYKNRPFKLEYQQHVHASSVKLIEPRTNFTLENSAVKYRTTLAANEEKVLSYKLEVVN
ncbi:unnamed protein product [Adineta ricciae]|nr:unnamed protein product [Adineta ricciae]